MQVLILFCACLCVLTDSFSDSSDSQMGYPDLKTGGDEATGGRVFLGATEEEAFIFTAILPPPASSRLTAPSVNLHSLNQPSAGRIKEVVRPNPVKGSIHHGRVCVGG